MSYIGNSPGVASQRIPTSFTATSGQTLFTLSSGYSLGYLDVFLNGAKLVNGQDYTATNGSTVTLTQAASAGDSVECIAYLPRGLSDGYLKSEADAEFLRKANEDGVLITSGTPANTLVTTNSGNVGIGTSSPQLKLVASNGGVEEIALSPTGGVNSGTYIQSYNRNTSSYLHNTNFASSHTWYSGATRAVDIDSSGSLLVGTTSNGNSAKFLVLGGSTGGTSLQAGFGGINGTSFQIYHADAGGQSGTATVTSIAKVASSGRSINAAGTINASGADYAEYMTKAGDFTVAKGDVVGIDNNGKLTNVFSDAVSFCVKSTAPSYVGGDTWGAELEGDELEAARQAVDRIAFAGQVPVNVLGATPGQFIIPVDSNGAIIGQAVSNPTFEQYQIAVGKVIAIESDGRARIIVKVA